MHLGLIDEDASKQRVVCNRAMDHRPPPGSQRPPPPQRAVSSSYALQQGLRRVPQPSRLQNVRSVSQPGNLVDLTNDGARAGVRNAAAFLGNYGTVSSPGLIQETGGDGPRPAKRARTESHALKEAEDNIPDVKGGIAHLVIPGSPLSPIPRPKHGSNRSSARKGPRRPVVDRAARRASGLEPPSIATRLPAPRLVADFSPWNGHHPEDILSETVVKAGYFDKAPGPNSTETNSAKPTIWPNLSQKNNMGLQTLSYLFAQVMEKRQVMGKCTAPSTFKPPPRVTVTDTKREAWLRDLSNPDVPLRKQSRTIPHGIRGKLLMEQCLGKDIPMPRAVWLAKCVGANELRAFRRKGISGAAAASGESKWVREWTVHVEQFLEGIIASCGQPQWQARMNYAVKLATSFYTERLLERDHYLDWIVSSFTEAAPEALSVWVIMVQLYWQDVIAFVKRGRKLAQAALEVLHQTTRGSLWIGDALRARLKKLVSVIAVASRSCLIIPQTWEKYSYLLAPNASQGNHFTLNSPAQDITRRNTRLIQPLRKTPRSTRSASLDLFALLDMTNLHVDIVELTLSCLACVPDVSKLVSKLLSWSATVYRTGDSRIHLAAAVLSHLRKCGYETDQLIIDFLKTEGLTTLVFNNVYRVIAELIRAQCFFTGRYLQWLMTSGSLSRGDISLFSNGLLAALPLGALQPHLLNTRNMILGRLINLNDETASIKTAVADIDSLDEDHGEPDLDLSSLSESAKMAVAQEISVRAAARAEAGMITLRYVCGVRTALESCGDHLALANVVQSVSLVDDPALLGTVADTVTMHAKSFAALGRLQSLQSHLFERYNTLRSQLPLDRRFITALTILTKRLGDRDHLVRLLEQDLAICEQQNTMSVCSPASDSIVSMHASNLASDRDIDAVFASGNNMDEQLMQRVFSWIVLRARKTTSSDAHFPSKICGWLDQLRTVAVEPRNFDQMAIDHVRACFRAPERVIVPCNVITALIAGGCATFAAIAAEANTPTAASIMLRLLTSDTIPSPGLHAAESYQYRIQQQLYCSAHSHRVIQLCITAMDYPVLPLDDPSLLNLVLDYAVLHSKDAMKALTSHTWSQASLANCSRLAVKLMSLGRPAVTNQTLEPRAIVGNADALSIVFCAGALKLHSIIEPEQGNGAQQAILEAIANGSEVWPQLLEGVGRDGIQEIYRWARDQVMSKAFESDGAAPADQKSVDRSLDILDVTFHATNQDESGSIVPMITGKLKALDAQLTTLDTSSYGEHGIRQATQNLHVLLHLSLLYSNHTGGGSESLDQSQCQLLASLSNILVHPKLQGQQELLEFIHDVASVLADSLSESSLAMLARSVASRDSILSCLFGTCSSPDAWLAIVSHPQPQGTQQQRALMKQAGGQQPGPSRQPHQQSPVQQHGFQRPPARVEGRPVTDTKVLPFPVRRWEIMADATPMIGDNDTSLSLGLFGARKV